MDIGEAKEILKKRPAIITSFILEVNVLLDMGKELSFEDVRQMVEEENILVPLQEKFPEDINLSPYQTVNDLTTAFHLYMNDVCSVLFNREMRKIGVENNGLCLLIAYANEIAQQLLNN